MLTRNLCIGGAAAPLAVIAVLVSGLIPRHDRPSAGRRLTMVPTPRSIVAVARRVCVGGRNLMAGVIVLSGVLVGWQPPLAMAETRVEVDGNLLYGWCRTIPDGLANEPVGGYCAGFIHGIVDVHGEKKTLYGFQACLPLSVTIRQLRRAVVVWLADHPEKRHLIAHGLVGEALSRAYPCR